MQAAPLTPSAPRPALWRASLAGLFLFVFAAAALSGPGRIDIVDGHTRYEVARSLVEHGDSIIRNPHVQFSVHVGRDGERYTDYRIPQTAAGVVAILAADATGPVSEPRRHFFFALTGAFAGAVLAVTYGVWFRALGHGPAASLAWGAAGFFCTPSWYYATSTFDDILGTATVVLAVAVAWLGRERRPLLASAAAGLLLGWAFNCKQPLGLFVLPVLAAGWGLRSSRRVRLAQIALVCLGMAVGVAGYKGYQDYKFPPGTPDWSEEVEKAYGPIWTRNPLPGLAGLALSPSAGALWYCPPLWLALVGWARWRRTRPAFCAAVLAASALFLLFVSFLTFFKGDPSWGPRYLTPVFALWWVFVPASLGAVRRSLVAGVLGLGVLVQLLALGVDPQRRFLETSLPFTYYIEDPWLGFDSRLAHLFHRPRELLETLSPGRPPAPAPDGGPVPTQQAIGTIDPLFWTSVVGRMPSPDGVGPLAVAAAAEPTRSLTTLTVYQRCADYYQVILCPRPWWAWQSSVAPGDRPVDPAKTLGLLITVSLFGLGLMVGAGRRVEKEPQSEGPCLLNEPEASATEGC
jgi:hypothetical protein